MTLAEWIVQEGRGAKQRLADAAGLSWGGLHALTLGKWMPRGSTAMAISRATSGAVSVEEIIDECAELNRKWKETHTPNGESCA